MNEKHLELMELPHIPREKIPGVVVFEVVVGDKLRGLKGSTGPVQIRGVYSAHFNDIVGCTVRNVIELEPNIIFYEISHFLNLLKDNEVEAIDMVFAPRSYHITCINTMDRVILGTKLSFVRKSYGENILKKVDKGLTQVKMNADELTSFYEKWRKFRNDNPYRFTSVILNNNNFATPLPWDTFLDKYGMQFSIENSKYASIPVDENPDIRYLYFDPLKTFALGLFKQTNAEFLDYFSPKNRGIVPVGIVIFDRDKYLRYQHEFTKVWTDHDKYNVHTWTVNQSESAVLYNAFTMAKSMALLDIGIEYYSKGVLSVNRGADAEYYGSIVSGKYTFDSLMFDIVQKRSILIDLLDKSKMPSLGPTTFCNQKVLEFRKTMDSRFQDNRYLNKQKEFVD